MSWSLDSLLDESVGRHVTVMELARHIVALLLGNLRGIDWGAVVVTMVFAVVAVVAVVPVVALAALGGHGTRFQTVM